MNVIMKEIDMIAYFTKKGDINPIRFRYNESSSDECIVIPVDRIITKSTNLYSGNLMYVFHCESFINDVDKKYEIKYEVKSNKWFLYRI